MFYKPTRELEMNTYIVHYSDRNGVEQASHPLTLLASWKYEAAMRDDGFTILYVAQVS